MSDTGANFEMTGILSGQEARKRKTPQEKIAIIQQEHNGKIAVAESNQRGCSDGFGFGCDNGEKLRVTFALDCCDREAIDRAASTGGYNSITVQDMMLRSVEKRFGNRLPYKPVQWLTDNGSAYTTHETRKFASALNPEPCTTAVSSPQSGREARENDEGRRHHVHAKT